MMYHYCTEQQQDEQIDFILRFLFEYAPITTKQSLYQQAQHTFAELDLASHYLLFSLVKERLPRRAKLLFAAEDYSGKQQTILEVMRHQLAGSNAL